MKTTKKLVFMATMLLSLFGINCKKTKPSPTEIPKTEEPGNKPDEPEKKVLIPIKFESATLTVDIKYQDNSSLISELSFSGGTRYLLTYSNQVLKKMERYNNSTKDYFVDYLITDNKIIRASGFESVPNLNTPTGKYQLEYSGGQISMIRRYAVSNALIETKSLVYESEGNLLTIKTEGTNTVLYRFSYDNKKGIFSAVKFVQLLHLELGFNFLLFGTNNLSTVRAEGTKEDLDYDYSYNTEGYPEQMNIKTESGTQHYKVSYQELK